MPRFTRKHYEMTAKLLASYGAPESVIREHIKNYRGDNLRVDETRFRNAIHKHRAAIVPTTAMARPQPARRKLIT